MGDYEPVDLDRFCNAGLEVFILKEMDEPYKVLSESPPIGLQLFWGLPFRIGADSTRCFIVLGGNVAQQLGNLRLQIGKTARYVVFAHSLLESRMPDGASPGHIVARYTFRWDDGVSLSVPIRERFEVTPTPFAWGDLPYLALPDQPPWLMPRRSGPWEAVGRRQAGAMQGHSRGYYLWTWENTRPAVPLDSITFEPTDRKFLIAAVTLSHLDEYPFCRTGRVPLIITLRRREDANAPVDLQITVDRGVATYPYPLPGRPAEEFISDDYRGWGEQLNPLASPAYAEIAAIPSATVTVTNRGEELGSARWGELLTGGVMRTPRLELEVVRGGKNWVHVTVLDDDTGRPVPCRVHFRSPQGIPYQPHGHHNHVNSNLSSWHIDVGGDLRLGQITYAYIDGKCQGWLPRGAVIVDVARGFEYEPLRTTVHIESDQRQLVLRLKRQWNMKANRWFSGDSHVHFLGPQGATLEARAEDVDVVNLLASQWGHLFTNQEDFVGRPVVSDDGGTIVYCSQENRQHFLGHLTLWGLKESVMPLCSDGPGEAEIGGTLDETMSHWADAAHAQGGTVILPHFPWPNGEPAVLIATGRADAVEMLHHSNFQHREYYRYLNCGYRLPLVGGTDKMSNETPIGLYRTYAFIPPEEEFNYENWCRSVRAGRTFLSSGPLLQFSVNGAAIGDTVHLPAGGGILDVEAEAHSIFAIHSLEIVQAGRVVASVDEPQGARHLRLSASVRIQDHTWLAARCGGPAYVPRIHSPEGVRGIFAHTSPIYVATGEEWQMFDLQAAEYMLTLIEGGLQYVRHTASHYLPGTVTYHHGEADHIAYLRRPFQEAVQAIHRRLHLAGLPH
jgi:hypothetical protein